MLKVDLDKCTRCGVCGEICPSGIISVGPEGPAVGFPKGCIACGHCVAVCPTTALDNEKNPLADQPEAGPGLEAAAARNFLRARRSIRCYQDRAVEREKLAGLLDVARHAPSGGNTQGLAYVVISDAPTRRAVTAAVIDWLEAAVASGQAWTRAYAGLARQYRETGKDVVLRDAPHLVYATAAQGFPLGRDNTHFALGYAELYAPALGLGTCWAGFVEMCALSGYEPLLALLGVPEGRVFSGAIMVGYPRHSYRRLAARRPLEVQWR